MASTPGQSLLLQIQGDASGAVEAAQSAGEAVNSLAGQIPGLASAMESPAEAASQLGETLTSAFEDPIGALTDLTSAVGEGLTTALGAIGPIGEAAAGGLGIVAAAAIGVGAAVFGLTDSAAESGEQVLAFSEQTGIAVQNVGALQFAVTAAGGSLSELTTVFRSIDMKAATDQGGKFSAALADMGINAAKFKTEDPETQLLQLAQAMQSGAAGGNLMADALAIGGRQLVNQIPLLMKLNAGLIQTGAALGVVWTPEQTEAAESFSLGVGTIETAVEDVGIKIGQALLPAMSQMVTSFAASPKFVDALTSATAFLASALSGLIQVTGLVGTALLKMVGPAATVGQVWASIQLATSHTAADQATYTAELNLFTAAAKAATPMADGLYNGSKQMSASLLDLAAHAHTAAVAIQTDLNQSMSGSTAAAGALQKAVDGVIATLEGDSKATQAQVGALQQVVAAQDLDVEAKTRAVDMIEKLIQAGVPLSSQITDFYNANVGLSKSYQELITAEDKWIQEDTKAAEEFVTKWQAANQKWLDGEVSAFEKAYQAQLKAGEASITKFGETYAAGAKLITTASTDLYNLQTKQTQSLYQQEVNAIQEWAAQQIAAFKGTDAQAAQFAAIIKAEVADKIAALGPQWATTWSQMAASASTALSGIASDFSAMAASSTGALKEIATALGGASSSLKDFSAAFKDLGAASITDPITGLTSINWGSLTSGVTSLIGAAIGLFQVLEHIAGNAPAVVQSIQSMGASVDAVKQSFDDPNAMQDWNTELLQLQGQAPLTGDTLAALFQGVQAGGQQATEAFSTLTNLLPEIDKNFLLATQTSGSLLATIKTAGPEATAAMTALNAQVSDFQSQASTTSGVWSTSFQALIKQSQTLGTNVASITSALATQTSNLTAGLNQEFKVTSDAYTAMAADQATLADTSASTADIAKATADLSTQQAIIAGTQVTSAAAAQGQAAAVIASVDAQMKAGTNFVDAVTAAEPAIQGLQAQLTATGYSGGAAFTLLNQMATLATGTVSGPLLKAVEGSTQAVVALGNMGALTQSNFAGLEDQISSTYQGLINQGASSQAAMAAIQPDLQAAWQLEQQYGVSADQATQSLINQGVQTGLVGEKQASSTQQMVDALNGVKTDLDEIVQKMLGLGSAAQTAAGQINGAFSTIQSPTVNLITNTVPGAQLSESAGASAMSTSGVPIADIPLSTVATSGLVYVRAGADVVGMLPPADLSALGPGATAANFSNVGGTGGNVVISPVFNISAVDGDSVARWLQNGGSQQILNSFMTGGALKTQFKRLLTQVGA